MDFFDTPGVRRSDLGYRGSVELHPVLSQLFFRRIHHHDNTPGSDALAVCVRLQIRQGPR